jgi:vitamin K-dependent gamma-carboxylase
MQVQNHNRQVAKRFVTRLFAPVDIASLVYFRVAFGAIMLWEVWRYFDHGWIKRYYIDPLFHFKYYGFDWVRPWPGDGMYLHFYVLGALAICVAVGLFYRVSTTLFFLGFTYIFLLDKTNYLNHFYLISLISLIMIFVPAHKAFSLDALLRPKIRSDSAPTWARRRGPCGCCERSLVSLISSAGSQNSAAIGCTVSRCVCGWQRAPIFR